jgi:hypothetical protein
MAGTAYVTFGGFTGPNPYFGDGTVGVMCSWVIFDESGTVIDGPAGINSVMANCSFGDTWTTIQGKLTSEFQSIFGDPGMTVVFMPA